MIVFRPPTVLHERLNFDLNRMKMDLEIRKISFVQEFLRIDNEEIISGLEKILRSRKTELYEADLKPMLLEDFNADIEKSLTDSENDRVTSAKNLKEEIKKWR